MTPTYVTKLSFTTEKTSIKAQKIDGLVLKIYGMVWVKFLIQDSSRRVWFFEETFILADTSMEIILKMPFLFLNNVNVEFAESRKLIWRFYIVADTLSTSNWI